MAHPNDDTKRSEYLSWVLAKTALEFGSDEVTLDRAQMANLVAAAERGVGNDMEQATIPGTMAGEVLLYVIKARLYQVGDFGIDKAEHLVSEFYRSTRQLGGAPYVRNGRGAGRDTVLKNWREFRPVAHYWAAYNLISFKAQAEAPGREAEFIVDHRGLHLSIAHGLLLSACACPLPRSTEYLMTRAEAWELAGIEPATVYLPPLGDDDATALEAFESRFR